MPPNAAPGSPPSAAPATPPAIVPKMPSLAIAPQHSWTPCTGQCSPVSLILQTASSYNNALSMPPSTECGSRSSLKSGPFDQSFGSIPALLRAALLRSLNCSHGLRLVDSRPKS